MSAETQLPDEQFAVAMKIQACLGASLDVPAFFSESKYRIQARADLIQIFG